MINKETIDIIEKYYHARDHNADYNKNNLGFGLIHYALIRNIRPKNILCVGSHKGYIPSILALACKNESLGIVDFVDAGYSSKVKDEVSRAWGGIGIWKTATKDYWKPLGVEDYIDIYCMTIEEFIDKYKERFYEYVYIDANHSYEGVKGEFELLWERVLVGGFITFHDILVDRTTDAGKCGVKRFWNEIKDNYSCITINKTAGLGIIQKTQKELK